MVIDQRNIRTGWEIPSEYYCDQPYVVITDDGAWLCVLTTGGGVEGAAGQHVVTMRSSDQGHTWSAPVDVEPADGPEASYAVLLKVPSGRIFCFYNHNTDNLREVRADDPPFAGGKCTRVDSQGHFVFKYSDDHGRSWSAERYDIPMRRMDIDRKNPYGGEICYFWNVGKPFILDNAAFVSLHKVGGFGEGFFTRSEGVLLKSANLLDETNPTKITWETLPDGDYGLHTPRGGKPISEEQSYSVLSDGSIYAVYRTIDGHPCCAYSHDGGHHWTEPKYKQYADGRRMKHPRAANFAWKCKNGKYLYWFHNHGGRFIGESVNSEKPYMDRNPVWFSGGVEVDTPEGKEIRWSQPEIVLYDDDPYIIISYPDLVEDGGHYYLTETQKNIARVHEVDPTLLDGLWNQFTNNTVATGDLVLNLPEAGNSMPAEVQMPNLPRFTWRGYSKPDYSLEDFRQGLTLDMWLRLDSLEAGQILLDTRIENGQGLCLATTERGTVELIMNDGRMESRWDCEPEMLTPGTLHHLGVIIDGGPKIIMFLVDGKFCDGGDYRQFGWGRFNPHMTGLGDYRQICWGNLNEHKADAPLLKIAPRMHGNISSLRLYTRALRTSEMVGNYRAGVMTTAVR